MKKAQVHKKNNFLHIFLMFKCIQIMHKLQKSKQFYNHGKTIEVCVKKEEKEQISQPHSVTISGRN